MSFLEYLVLLQKRWRIWVAAILVGVLLAVAASLLGEKRYTAVATSFVTVSDVDAAGAGEIFQGSQFAVQRMASYSSLGGSPDVLGPVIEELGLDASLRAMREKVEVSSPAGSVLLEVSATDTDPARAADLADAVSQQLGLVIEELETPRGLAASTVKVTLTNPADEPVAPSSPRTVLNLLLGVAGGAAIGLVLALLRNHYDRRIKSVRDVQGVTGTLPLGSTYASHAVADGQLVAMRYRSTEAEQYRTIKAALRLVDTDGREPGQIVVTAPTGLDKTEVAANLAVSWALTGARVCLVDADLRRPTASRVFAAGSTGGLSDVLSGDTDLETVLAVRDDWAGLTVLPAGYLPVDPVALLGSEAMGAVIAELRSRFDVVVYDAGPVLAVSDSLVLARQVDGLVLVVRAGQTTRDEVDDCLALVRETGVRLLGTVRSGVRMRGRRARHSLPEEGELRPVPAQRGAELSPTA